MITTRFIADRLGVDQVSVGRWAVDWYGPIGQGKRWRLSPVDVLVARAWYVIDGNPPARGTCPPVNAWERRRLAETAIRHDPKRWLLIEADRAETFDEAEDAAVAWLWSASPAATLIDLASTP